MSAPVLTVLERIVAETREELERRKREAPIEGMPAPAATPRRNGFRDAIAGDGIGVIAEFKRRSPSAGILRERPELLEILPAYQAGGAVALSILTEGPNFDGSLRDLRTAGSVCDLPLLRKDFIVDPYQLHEAVSAGASAVLLIVAALSPDELGALHAYALALGLDVLVEVHDRPELLVAIETGAEIIGINNRDLRDFSVDVKRTEQLMAEIPAGTLVVSESGIGEAAQLEHLQTLGVQAVLVGESLMRAEDPAAALAKLTSFRYSGQDI